jgi:predicted cation transporter
MDLDGSGSVWKDMGYFITGFLIVSGLALPVALQQAGKIGIGAMIMSIAGGVVLYATVAVYQHFFSQKDEF